MTVLGCDAYFNSEVPKLQQIDEDKRQVCLSARPSVRLFVCYTLPPYQNGGS